MNEQCQELVHRVTAHGVYLLPAYKTDLGQNTTKLECKSMLFCDSSFLERQISVKSDFLNHELAGLQIFGLQSPPVML